MAASAPVPIAIIASTAATPIVMPMMVSDVCSRLRRNARKAMARLERVGTRFHPLVVSLSNHEPKRSSFDRLRTSESY